MTDMQTEAPAAEEAQAEAATNGQEVAGTEAVPAQPTSGTTNPATKHKLPEGVSTPIEALNWLKTHKEEGASAPFVDANFQPQRMYGFVKSPGKDDPFPVKHYDAEGNTFAEPQVSEHGVTLTRPGVVIAEVVAWWGRKGERDQAKADAKAAKAAEKAAKASGTTTAKAAVQVPGTVPVEAEEEAEVTDGSEVVEAE